MMFSFYCFSLLSSFSSLFAFTSSFHLAAGKHTTVMSLQELGSLVKSVHLLALLCFLLVHDGFEGLALSTLLKTFSILLTDLTKLILSVLAVSFSLILLLSLFTHLGIVRVERLSVLLISTVVGCV